MFASVFSEAADTCLRSVICHLKANAFTVPDSEDDEEELSLDRETYRSPPLASLLPQLKGAALKLLPSDPSAAISADVREMLSSPALDTLCVSLFDLGLPRDMILSSSTASTANSSSSTLSSCHNSNGLEGHKKGTDADDLSCSNSSTNWPF